MTFNDIEKKVRKLLETDIPPGNDAVKEGRSLAGEVRIGQTRFMKEMGVSSEAEFKRQCIREKRITYHAHIGLNSWDSTAAALNALYEAGQSEGFTVDRAGICLDRRMGLPVDHRKKVPAETGPMLESPEEWAEVGRISPIQPHMGDFMIGFPASTENTVYALKAGVTTIGNLSQFFSHEVPGWKNHITTSQETVRAISLMGALSEQGTLVHSYLEDGFGALFYDCATVAGWAFLEKYLVETLMGAKLSHCIGGLTTDPVKRAGWIFALHEIHEHDCLGSMFYGDTISFSDDFTTNSGLVSEYLMWDILAQLECPTGHAVLPLPLTEGLRIPSIQEIIEAQKLGHRIQKTAETLFRHIDFSESYKFADTIVSEGKKVFNHALQGLQEAGVNIKDPLELLFVLKELGPAVFEEVFGAGIIDETCIRMRKPVIRTDVFKMSEKSIEENRRLFIETKNKRLLYGRRLLIASTDVHEHAILILKELCAEAGAEILYLGSEKNPDEVALAAVEQNADGILLSTHNGMALQYAERLKSEMARIKCRIPVVIGGVLNQKTPGRELPIDVSSHLKELGFKPYSRLQGQLINLLDFNKIEK